MMGAARAGLWHSPAAVAGLLLDGLSVTVRGAWGMRKLRAAYAGSCIRVRRSSDNAEQDIGFDGSGNLDTSALLTFVGSGSGYVSKWYDQSSVGADFIQATSSRQSLAVSSGTLFSMSNTAARPAIQFLGGTTTTFLGNSSFSLGSTTTISSHSVGARPSVIDAAARFLSFTGSGEANDYSGTNSVIFAYFNGGSTANGFCSGGRSTVATPSTALTPFQLSSVWDGTNNTLLCDSTSGTATAYTGTFASPGGLYIGTEAGSVNSNEQWSMGLMAEHVITSGTLSSADQTAIRGSQKSYYGTA